MKINIQKNHAYEANLNHSVMSPFKREIKPGRKAGERKGENGIAK
jgi:hypothetical protein